MPTGFSFVPPAPAPWWPLIWQGPLRWGYRYGRSKNESQVRNQWMVNFGGITADSQWHDATAVIVDGRVLLTPAEADSLYCLNLFGGDPLWEAVPRQDDLYLACVHGGKIVLVGCHDLRAIKLADGKPAWAGRTVALPEGSTPSGRGFYSGKLYYVPLSSAEVVAVDLDAGKIVQASKSREGRIPGNLVCYKGKIISQGWDGVELFWQADAFREDITRRLAADHNDAEALRRQGELLLDAGKTADALSSLRRAYQLGADTRTRELLRDTLLGGLHTDFANYRKQTDEIERLLDNGDERATYLRLMADGLQQAGEWRPAFDHYMRLIDLDRNDRCMEEVSPALMVRRDRWIQSGLAALRGQVSGKLKDEIDAAVGERLKAALAEKSPDDLRRFLNNFDGCPAALTVRRELINRLVADHRYLEAELLLWRDRESSDPAVAGSAVAQLAEMFQQAERYEGAAACCRQLQRQFADVVCRDGKTGKQLVAALPQAGPVAALLKPDAAWPLGNVEVGKAALHRGQPMNFYNHYAVQYRNDPAPFFSGATLQFDQSQQAIVGYDGFGKQRLDCVAGRKGPAVHGH